MLVTENRTAREENHARHHTTGQPSAPASKGCRRRRQAEVSKVTTLIRPFGREQASEQRARLVDTQRVGITDPPTDRARGRTQRGHGVDLMARLTLVAAGFAPVSLIAVAAFGLGELRHTATHVLIPVVALAAVAAWRLRRPPGHLILAVAMGVLATFMYDLFRFGFLAMGWMAGDPIPHIGRALDLHPAWIFGYLWRYVGNGGGLAVAFVTLGLRGVRQGVAYGLVVCAGLLTTLAISPFGQTLLFDLNVVTVAMAIGGHAIYGAVLGVMTAARGLSDLPADRTT